MDTKVHDIMEASDAITLVGELEHLRRHELLAAVVESNNIQNAVTDDARGESVNLFYSHWLNAQALKKFRRSAMAELFSGVEEHNWCSVKTAAIVKQLLLELDVLQSDGWAIDTVAVVDSIISDAIGKDISGCASCREDMEVENGQEDSRE